MVLGVLAVLAIGYALWRNWGTVADYEWHLSPAWMVLGAALIFVSMAWQGLTYCHSVELLSPDHPPRAAALSIWARSIIARYIPGNVMMIIGRAVMASEWGVPKRTTPAATVYEQVIALGLSAIASVGYVAGYGNPGDPRLLWVLLAVPVVLLLLHPRVFHALSTRALRLIKRPPIETRFTEGQVAGLVVRYAVGTVILCVGVWALVHAAAGPGSGGPAEIGLGFLMAFVISMVAFILPSGLGVREGVLTLVLSRHMPTGPALAIAVGLRFALTVIEIAFVSVATVVGRRR